jgi:hypothetical protein
MAKPMPLTVYGPVTPISPFVRVTGVLPTAEVGILDNGQPIGHAIATNPGELLVHLTSQPQLGHSITAVQKTNDGTSEPSAQAIPVVDIPDPLPVPVIVSALNTCMVDILIDGLVPGARIVTAIGGQPFGSSVAAQATSWAEIDATRQITPGSRADIHQEAQIGATTRVGKTVESPSIPALQIATDLLPPPSLSPLTQCDTSREFLQVVAGAGTTIANDGQSESWINPAAAFHGYGAPPLRKGSAVATQSMPRCKRGGQPVTLPVAPATTPPAPVVSQELCPQTLRLTASNLAPGGILHVARQVQLNPAGTSWSTTSVGDLGIQYPTQAIDLPPDIALTDPAGPVFISLSQSRCAGASLEARIKVAAVAGRLAPPKIIEPLFDCSRGIPVKGAHPGAMVWAVDAASGIAISDATGVAQTDFILRPWFPLAAGKRVLLRQKGCNADGDSPTATVKALPQPLPVPKIVEPVRPEAPLVKATGIVPGARLYLLVNNQLRPGSFDVYADTAVIPVTGAPLADKDRVFLIQKLCDLSSNLEGPGASVTRGHLKVSAAPPQVARGNTAQVVVTATDADTGAPVSAEVRLNNQHVGTTGVPFAYAPHTGDSNPAGIVSDGAAYFDATFTITLVDPTWTLTMHAAPIPAFFDVIRIDTTKMTWKVTPDWNPALAKTVTVTPTPPTASGSVQLPIPTGAVKTVTVEISGQASTQGGNLNGFTVLPQSFAIGTDSKKVAFHGPTSELIAWLLTVKYITDQQTYVIFNIVPTLQGISP